MAKSGTGGSMNKHNAYQNTHNKSKYAAQTLRTAKNKARHVKSTEAFKLKKHTEKTTACR